MKIWQLVSGIISCLVFFIITFQSCAVLTVTTIDEIMTDTEEYAGDTSAAGGMGLAFILLVAGITSAAVWRTKSRGADIALIILFGLAAIVGFENLGVFGDLEVWSWWAAICAGMAFISLCLPRKKNDKV